MSSLIACPGCKNTLDLPEETLGQRVQCPRCALEFAALTTLIPPMEVEPPAAGREAPRNHSSSAGDAALPTAQPAPALQTGFTPANKAAPSKPAGETPSIYCIRCGTKFSSAEDACPDCGYPSLPPLESALHRRRRALRRMRPISGFLPTLAAILLPAGPIIVFVGAILAEVLRRSPVRFWVPFLVISAGVVTFICALVLCALWLYQAWQIVLREDEEYSPGLMVGLLFVPFFNFYWMFRAIPGLSAALEKELKYLLPGRVHATGWAPGVAACALALVPFPPIWVIAICMLVAWMLLTNNAANRLVRVNEARLASAEQEAANEATRP